MDIQRLTDEYRSKTDDELLQLLSEAGQLTHDADFVLRGELARRQIALTALANARSASTLSSHRAPQERSSPSVVEFLPEVVHLYHDHFGLFVRLTAPAVLVGCFAVLLGRHEARMIALHLPRGAGILQHRKEIFEMVLATHGGFFVSWMTLCFSFAAICYATRDLAAGSERVTASACFKRTGERISSFLRISVPLYALTVVAVGLAIAASLAIVSFLGAYRVSNFQMTVISFVCVGIAFVLLSRLGLAVPAVVLDQCSIGQAMFRSDELTEGKWGTLTALVAKSLVGGYIAAIAPFWLAAWIPPAVALPSWFPWVLTAASIAG